MQDLRCDLHCGSSPTCPLDISHVTQRDQDSIISISNRPPLTLICYLARLRCKLSLGSPSRAIHLLRPRLRPSFSTSRPVQLTSITPSRDELLNANLSQRHTQSALEAFHRAGLVVIEDVVSHEDIDRLNAVMVRDAHRPHGKR